MEKFLESIKNWAKNEEKIESVIVVGSYRPCYNYTK